MECVLSSFACPPTCIKQHACWKALACCSSSSSSSPSPTMMSASQRPLLPKEGFSAVCRLWVVRPYMSPASKMAMVVCSSESDDSRSSPKISSSARIRSEVMAPFRTVRMFFYLAFIASGSIGALTSLPRLIAAVGHAPNASPVGDVLTGLGIDLVAILVFAFLYRVDVEARDQQLAKLSREETLAGLKLELKNKRVITIGQMRGIARLVIVAGPASHVAEAWRRSEPNASDLLERGVLVVSFATDGQVPNLELPPGSSLSNVENDTAESSKQLEKLWRATPIYSGEWTRWLKEQKKLANVSEDSPVYLSLRLDGRVRGSGTGFPPWGAFVAQLPPLKGIWNGVLDGMDGRI